MGGLKTSAIRLVVILAAAVAVVIGANYILVGG